VYYHDHIIRDADDYNRTAEYIENNPRNWRDDSFYAAPQQNDYKSDYAVGLQ
jgi:hypothetical protein